MIRPQTPASPIFLPAQAVPAADVAAKGFSPIAAIEANHIVVAHGLANRDSGGECFFGNGLLMEPIKAYVDDRDQIRKLIGTDFVVSQVTPNEFRGKCPMTVFRFHGSLLGKI